MLMVHVPIHWSPMAQQYSRIRDGMEMEREERMEEGGNIDRKRRRGCRNGMRSTGAGRRGGRRKERREVTVVEEEGGGERVGKKYGNGKEKEIEQEKSP